MYESNTESLRKQGDAELTQLFLAVVKPHILISSSTLPRRLKATLERTGIDTGILEVHSVWSVAARQPMMVLIL